MADTDPDRGDFLSRPVHQPKQVDPIVGHKTFRDERGNSRHEPLRQSEADSLREHVRVADARRAELMPTEQDAIRMLFDAWLRLKQDFGWREAIYAPKDGCTIEVIECGSTGIHKANWMSCAFFSGAEGWPTHPTLFREPKETP